MHKIIFSVLLAIAGLQLSLSAGAEQIHEIRGNTGWFSTGQTLVQNMGSPTYIERLIISAVGRTSVSRLFVYADGELVGNPNVPQFDPDYTIVVRKTVTTIVIKFEGTVTIQDFRIYASDESSDSFGPTDLSGLNTPAQLGKAVLSIIRNLQECVSDSEFRKFLMPLRKSAILLAAKGDGRVLMSNNTQAEARHMVTLIKAAQTYLLDNLSYNEHLVNEVEGLMFVKERLESLYEL